MNDFEQTRILINSLLKDYKITLKSLSKITGIDYTWVKNYVDNKIESYTVSDLKKLSILGNMVLMLFDGVLMIKRDDRVKGVIDVLVSLFELNLETLAIYAEIDLEDVQSFMKDTNSISCEKKYKLAVASLFLHYLFKNTPEINNE